MKILNLRKSRYASGGYFSSLREITMVTTNATIDTRICASASIVDISIAAPFRSSPAVVLLAGRAYHSPIKIATTRKTDQDDNQHVLVCQV